ncbi:MAG TPA: phosphatase PAP2 family protein [Flavobacteriaceae bacterium]|nr:phosphatase PAP2 family protein [Flavobacteriaceae bacterium]HIP27447.1 phosphatase PAP2 family protein [Flavobacteriaceae bacterium]
MFLFINRTPFSDRFVAYDKELFTYLNGFGNEKWDWFWLLVTEQKHWVPLFIVLLILLFKAFGLKKGLILLVFIALFITFSDQLVNLIKYHYMRLRPCSDPDLELSIRAVLQRSSYSFVSGHSTTSFAMSTFFILLLKKHFKHIRFLLIWPMLFAYSRVYLGVHFPLDIFTGMYLGIFEGFLFFYLTQSFFKKIKI